MAQVREGRYAVLSVNEDDIDLLDINMRATPLVVEKEHDFYDTEIRKQIQEIEEGDILEGHIQSEDILHPNGIWWFLEFEIVGHDPGWVYN